MIEDEGEAGKGAGSGSVGGVAVGESVRVVHEPRSCPACGYDLRGQSVVREPEYGWMVVRCTECGRVSPVHMVSAGARAVTIGAGVLSGVWVLACLVLVIGLGAALFGVTSVAFEAAVVSVREGRAEEGLRALVRGLTALFWLVPIALPFGLVLAALTAGRGVRGMSVAASGVVLVATVLWLIPVVDAVNAVSYARSLSVRDSVLASLGGIGWVYGLTLGGGVVCWSVLAASPWVLRLIVRTAGPGWVARAMSGLWEGVSKEGLAARRAGG